MKQIAQGLIIFAATQFAVSYFVGGKVPGSGPATTAPAIPEFNARPDGRFPTGGYNPIPQVITPIWPMNKSLDISIYVASSIAMPSFAHLAPETLVLEEKNFVLGDWKESRIVDTSFLVPKEVQNNGTLWAHVYVALHGHPLDPTANGYSEATAYHFLRPLNQMLAKKKVAKTKKLLGASNDADTEQETPRGRIIASHYHPNFTMSFIPDSGLQSYVKMHPAVRQHVVLEATGARDASGQNGWHYPILFVNTFWQLRDHMTELNSSVTKVPLHITLNNLNNWKFSLYASIDEGVKEKQRQVAAGGPIPAGGDGSEFEEFKRVLIDTNIYLLSTTAVVSVLHMVFEMLAFKSDIVSFDILAFEKGVDHFDSHTGATRRTTLASPFEPSLLMSLCKPSSSCI